MPTNEAASQTSPATQLFLRHHAIDVAQPPLRVLEQMVRAFAEIPYENLTKIVRSSQTNESAARLHSPFEVIAEHFRTGAGGTCFSLTASLLHLVRSLGWEAQPILADRRYGVNTHCALTVQIDGKPHLLDPGYLVLTPMRLDCKTEQTLQTRFNEVVLAPHLNSTKIDLLTRDAQRRKYRLTYTPEPVDESQFLHAWQSSFEWDMMKYPLLTRVTGDRQIYLQANKLQIRTRDNLIRREIDPQDLPTVIHREFGIQPSISTAAIQLLDQKGDPIGSAHPS